MRGLPFKWTAAQGPYVKEVAGLMLIVFVATVVTSVAMSLHATIGEAFFPLAVCIDLYDGCW